jgi:hypothetical protein
MRFSSPLLFFIYSRLTLPSLREAMNDDFKTSPFLYVLQQLSSLMFPALFSCGHESLRRLLTPSPLHTTNNILSPSCSLSLLSLDTQRMKETEGQVLDRESHITVALKPTSGLDYLPGPL